MLNLRMPFIVYRDTKF